MSRSNASLDALQAMLSFDAGLELLHEPSEIERFSRDAFDYSPVLAERLASCRADLVVRPADIAAVERLAAACAIHRVPLTVRAAGTGNYGQCVPLEGGVVMLTSSLRAIQNIDTKTGVVTVERLEEHW